MTFIATSIAPAERLVYVDGTSVDSAASASSTIYTHVFNLSEVTKIGSGYLFKAQLKAAANANSKGLVLKVGTHTITTVPNTTTLNAKGITLHLRVFKKANNIVKYVVEYMGNGNPRVEASGDMSLIDFIGETITIEIVTNTPTAAADLVLNGVSLTKLDKE